MATSRTARTKRTAGRSRASRLGIRIAELVRLSGTPKETIHYYLRVGLLRKPKKTSHNMAYYEDSHVEQLKLIKRLRTESYLPLEVIKKVLKDGKLVDSARRLDLAGELFGQNARTEFEPRTVEEIAAATGLSLEHLERYRRAGLLRAREDSTEARFGWEDVRIAEILASALREAGDDAESFVVERFQILERHVANMVRDETAHFFGRVLQGGDPRRAVDLLRGGRETIGRYLAVARMRRLHETISSVWSQTESAFRGATVGTWQLSAEAKLRYRTKAREEELKERLGRGFDPVTLSALLSLSSAAGEPERAQEIYQALSVDERGVREPLLAAAEAMIEAHAYDAALSLLDLRRPPAQPEKLEEALFASAVLGRLHKGMGGADLDDEAGVIAFLSAQLRGETISELTRGISSVIAAKTAPASDAFAEARARYLLARVQAVTPPFLGLRGDVENELSLALEAVTRARGSAQDPGGGALERLELNVLLALSAQTKDDKTRQRSEAKARAIDPGAHLQG